VDIMTDNRNRLDQLRCLFVRTQRFDRNQIVVCESRTGYRNRPRPWC
jgi:hypothetical protein